MTRQGTGSEPARTVASHAAPVFPALLITLGSQAGEGGTGRPADPGLIEGALRYLDAQPFVLLFLTLALGTAMGRRRVGSISLGSTAGTLLVGILISLWAYLGHGIRYEVPSLLTTIWLNLFMFAVGLKVGPQFFAGLRLDGLKFVAVALILVGSNFVIAFAGARLLALPPGFATGLISGSMTDSAVIGAATGAVESGSYRPPDGIEPAQVLGNVAAGYALTYLFSLVGIILLVRYLPRMSGIDARAAGCAAEEGYGSRSDQVPAPGADVFRTLPRLGVDVRAYRVENQRLLGRRLNEVAAEADVPVFQLLRGGKVINLATDPVLQPGDVVTLVGDVDRLLGQALGRIGPEVADEQARSLELEVADLVVTDKRLVGLRLQEVVAQLRCAVYPGAERVGRLVQPVALIRAGDPMPFYPQLRLQRGDVARVLGPRSRIDELGKHVGAVVRASTASDVLTLALGLVGGYVVGYLSVTLGEIPISLGTPAGVMLAGIAISTLRSRYPLWGGPVSEGARSLLQDLGLDLFIAVVALNTAQSVVGAFSRGGVLGILAVGLTASFLPPLAAWIVGLKLLRLNPAVLMGALCGARFSTPALRAAQEESGSAVPAVGYPVPYAVTAVLVLVSGYLALFL